MGQWSNLPLELIDYVDGYLDFVDKVRVRAVCMSWNSYLPKLLKLRSEHLPWLLQEDNAKGASLYCPHEAKVYPLDLPEAQQRLFKGSSHGWVFTMQDVNSNSSSVDDIIYLFNPLTRARIQLPPRSTFPDIKEYRPDRVGQEYVLKDTSSSNPENDSDFIVDKGHVNLYLTEKIVLSSSPSSDDFVAVAIYGGYCQLAWCKRDHKKWTPFTKYSSVPPQPAVMDVIFHNGRLHALYASGKLVVFESIQPDPTVIVVVAEAPEYFLTSPMYLVECSNLGLIMVARDVDPDYEGERQIVRTCGFEVYKLADSIDSSKCWVEVEDICDNMLFLGLNSSLSISVRDFNYLGYKRNCIYFTDESRAFMAKAGGQEDSDIGIFNLEDGSFESLPGFKCEPKFIWPPPIWVTPSAY